MIPWNGLCDGMSTDTLANALSALIGEGKVASAPADLAAHSGDKWFAAHSPEVVVFAETTADVAAVLQLAQARKIPVTARGAGGLRFRWRG